MPCASVSIGPDCQGCQPQKGEVLLFHAARVPAPGGAFPPMAGGGGARPAHLMCRGEGGAGGAGLRQQLRGKAESAARSRRTEGKVKALRY